MASGRCICPVSPAVPLALFEINDLLVIRDRDADLVVSDGVQHLERLGHRDKVARVVQVHECAPELRSLT